MIRKTINITLLIWMMLFVTIISIQAQNPPLLEVSDIKMTEDANRKFRSRVYSKSDDNNFLSPNAFLTQEVSALFHNKGTKAIKSVKWEYVLFRDAAKTDEAYTYKTQSKTPILPGETVRLKKAGWNIARSPYNEIRITQIEYSDGTIWR